MKAVSLTAPLIAIALLGSVVALPQLTHAACDPITIVSDANTTVGDTSATLVSPLSPYWTANIPGAQWIWGNTPIDLTSNQTLTFTRTFTLDSVPSSATLSVTADDLYVANVNGTQVGANSEADPFMSVATINIAPYLVVGTNTVTFQVTNLVFSEITSPSQDPAGLLYAMNIQPSCTQTSGGSNGGGSDGNSGQIYHSPSTGPTSPSGTTNGGDSNGSAGSGSGTGSLGGASGTIIKHITELFGSTATTTSTTTGTSSAGTSTESTGNKSGLAAAALLFGKLPLYVWITLILLLIALALLANELNSRKNKNGGN